jgi:hypothetical protein
MQITPVDEYKNLFEVRDAFPQSLVEKILFTPWMQLKWQREKGQEHWLRRRIVESELPWINEWNASILEIWPMIEQTIGLPLNHASGTAWWVDEPGFTVMPHTDGSLPGAMQITWISDNSGLGTCFYHDKSQTQLRRRFMSEANVGYIMINFADKSGYNHLHWHSMMNPVPEGTFRLSSYTLIHPK